MALTTFATVAGVFTTTQFAKADTVSDANQVALVSPTDVNAASEGLSNAETVAIESDTASVQSSVNSQAGNVVADSKSPVGQSTNLNNFAKNTTSGSTQSTDFLTASQAVSVPDTVENTMVSDTSRDSNIEATSMTSLAATATRDGLNTENGNIYYYQNGQ